MKRESGHMVGNCRTAAAGCPWRLWIVAFVAVCMVSRAPAEEQVSSMRPGLGRTPGMTT